MKSLGSMIQQIDGLAGTADVSAWEAAFIESVTRQTGTGKDTRMLSEKQAVIVERIYRKHFGDSDT